MFFLFLNFEPLHWNVLQKEFGLSSKTCGLLQDYDTKTEWLAARKVIVNPDQYDQNGQSAAVDVAGVFDYEITDISDFVSPAVTCKNWLDDQQWGKEIYLLVCFI